MFNNIDEALNWLYTRKNKNKDFSRIKYLINKLDIYPNYKTILISGTNGKGSTALTIKEILKNSNMHVGLFTSPFVVSFNDRIMINDRFISNAEIMHYLGILYQENNQYLALNNEEIPFFELTFLMSLMFFKDRNIVLGIFECGIGGKYDTVNILNPDVSIITSIGYDHMNVLGNTLDEILDNKLGIARPNKPLLINNNEKLLINNDIGFKLIDIHDSVKNIITNEKYTFFEFNNNTFKTALLGEYQAYNTALAISASYLINPKITADLINYSLEYIYIPGRLEKVSSKPLIYLDGAHNKSAIKELTNNIKLFKNNRKLVCVFYALKDKDYQSMLNILNNYVDEYYFTSINDSRATDYHLYLPYINKDYKYFDDCYNLLEKIKDDSNLYLFTGSLHFVSVIRNLLK